LGESFRAFNEAADSLKTYYNRLEERVSSLNRELAEKSVALEENLKKTSALKRRQENILRSLPSGVVVFDRSGRAETINSRGEEITGYSQIEVAGKRAEEIFDGQIGDPSIGPPRETSFTNRDGRLFHLHLLTSPLVDDEAGFVLIFHDITGEKKLKEALERGKRLAAMGEMAAKLAHEIRNPLGILRSSAQLMGRRRDLTDRDREMIGYIISESDRINELVTNLLDRARPRDPVKAAHELGPILQHVAGLIEGRCRKKQVELAIEQPARPLVAVFDRDQMIQVLFNLLLNAIQSVEEGTGKVCIHLYRKRHEVCMDIEDNGPGVPEDQRESILEPFVSHRAGGMGLGLSINMEILRSHGGRLQIGESGLGGARFTICLDNEE